MGEHIEAKYVAPPEVAEIVGRIFPAAMALYHNPKQLNSVHHDKICLGRIELLCYAVKQKKNKARFCYPLALKAVRDNLDQINDSALATLARREATAAGLYFGGAA